MEKIKVLSVNISEWKGTIKIPVDKISLTNIGILGDAHAGKWHRQVSLLGKESIDKAEQEIGRKLTYGEFAENITTEGFPLYQMKPFDRLVCGNLLLEVTQIGKKCHGTNCAIYQETGNCVMPKEGIFCRVLGTGNLMGGMELEYHPKIYRLMVITLSDRASAGEYEDKSGPRIRELLELHFSGLNIQYSIFNILIPDDPHKLEELLYQA